MVKELDLIVAVANRNVIGVKNSLPWHYSADLQKFKEVTTGSTVIMGSRTYESIGKPLPNRENFVLNPVREEWTDERVRYFASLPEAVRAVKTEKAFIIGGASVYRKVIEDNLILRLYMTRIHRDFEGDAFFPEIPARFRETSRERLQEHPLLEFITYTNTEKPAEISS